MGIYLQERFLHLMFTASLIMVMIVCVLVSCLGIIGNYHIARAFESHFGVKASLFKESLVFVGLIIAAVLVCSGVIMEINK